MMEFTVTGGQALSGLIVMLLSIVWYFARQRDNKIDKAHERLDRIEEKYNAARLADAGNYVSHAYLTTRLNELVSPIKDQLARIEKNQAALMNKLHVPAVSD